MLRISLFTLLEQLEPVQASINRRITTNSRYYVAFKNRKTLDIHNGTDWSQENYVFFLKNQITKIQILDLYTGMSTVI